jgi:hypothetical protein
MPEIPRYADLRKAKFRPRVHPNGFIQLNLDDTGCYRLHVWPDDDLVQGQKTNHPIHDHIFTMHSRVIWGALMQVTMNASLTPDFDYYDITCGDEIFTHEIFTASYSTAHESVLLPSGVRVRLSNLIERPFIAGKEYTQPAGTFHETKTLEGLTATLMTKVKVFPKHTPRILIPLGVEPDNDFVREAAYDDEVLWEYIDRALELAKAL